MKLFSRVFLTILILFQGNIFALGQLDGGVLQTLAVADNIVNQTIIKTLQDKTDVDKLTRAITIYEDLLREMVPYSEPSTLYLQIKMKLFDAQLVLYCLKQ